MQKTPKYLALSLKAIAFSLILLIGTGTLLAFRANRLYDDLWQQLGISKTRGEENIKNSFLNGYFHYWGAEKAKNILVGDRAAVARDLMSYVKQQVNSPAFIKEYQTMRQQAKPVEPTGQARTKEAIRQEKIAEMEKGIKESEALVAKMPEMAKTMESTIEMFKNNLKEYKDSNSTLIQMFYDGEVFQHEQNKKRYEEDLVKWQKDFPADCKQMIRARLAEFVSLAKTVDFNAELKLVNGKKKFVNPKYEAKPSDWKQIFRAGKEVIQPAIAFAEAWMKE